MAKMKKLALLTILLLSFIIVDKTNALSLGDSTGNYNITSSRIEEHGGQFVNGYRTIDGVQNGYESTFFMISDTAGLNYDLQNLEVQIDRTIPKNSLVTFNFSIKTRNVGFNYYGLSFKNATTIYDSCVGPYSGTGISVGSTNSYNTTNVGCTITLLTNNDKTSFTAIQDARIAWVYNNSYTMGAGVQPEVEVSISPGSWHQLTNDGLSASDRAWLEEVLPDSTTVGEVEQAIDNARESEKDEYEEQAQETEDTANDESSAAQGTATTLLSVVGQFIGVLTSAQPTNCNLNGNLVPHLPLGQLNLCQNSPPAAITILGSLLLIAFVVPLAYHTVKRMLSLIGSFQS